MPETIEIDGEKKSTRNSEGNFIADTEEGIRNFYKWFGNSKAVDKDGRPLVVYHTTNTEFDTFDRRKANRLDWGFFGAGFYFAGYPNSGKAKTIIQELTLN